MQKELRFNNTLNNLKDRYISGKAVLFDTMSNLIADSFYEIIDNHAISEDLILKSDILMLYNFDENQIPLARSKAGRGSLKLEIDYTGLNFSFRAKKTDFSIEIYESIKSGDLQHVGIYFNVAEGGDNWQKLSNGKYLRTITKIEEIKSISILFKPQSDKLIIDVRNMPKKTPLEKLNDYYEKINNLNKFKTR